MSSETEWVEERLWIDGVLISEKRYSTYAPRDPRWALALVQERCSGSFRLQVTDPDGIVPELVMEGHRCADGGLELDLATYGGQLYDAFDPPPGLFDPQPPV